jgi:acetylornithine deacetylase/succinyl-diaminopimelate desuccinylase-like protein
MTVLDPIVSGSVGARAFLGEESEVTRILRDLIRLDTSNPPGNERPAAEYLADLFRSEGIEPLLLEPAPRRTSVVARVRGDQSLPPLLLSAHLDVVPAHEPDWEFPPFAAEAHSGYIWGRGAVDMKHMAAMSAVVLLNLKRWNVPLARDVIFAGVADEETGGRHGAKFLVDSYRALIEAEFCFTEAGGWPISFPRGTIIPVQVAERGFEWLKVRVRGIPGHGSIPRSDSAIPKLATALDRLARSSLWYRVTPAAREFLKAVAAVQRRPASYLLRGLLCKPIARGVLNCLPEKVRYPFRSMLFNTATATMISAGVKVNVIPSEAEAHIDGRYLPGMTRQEFLDELCEILGRECEVERIEGGPPVEMPVDSAAMAAIRRVFARRRPDARVVPYMAPGVTDAKHYARAGIVTYGFAPVALKPDEPFTELYHAPNERISIEAVETGLSWLLDVVVELAARKDFGSSRGDGLHYTDDQRRRPL